MTQHHTPTSCRQQLVTPLEEPRAKSTLLVKEQTGDTKDMTHGVLRIPDQKKEPSSLIKGTATKHQHQPDHLITGNHSWQPLNHYLYLIHLDRSRLGCPHHKHSCYPPINHLRLRLSHDLAELWGHQGGMEHDNNLKIWHLHAEEILGSGNLHAGSRALHVANAYEYTTYFHLFSPKKKEMSCKQHMTFAPPVRPINTLSWLALGRQCSAIS